MTNGRLSSARRTKARRTVPKLPRPRTAPLLHSMLSSNNERGRGGERLAGLQQRGEIGGTFGSRPICLELVWGECGVRQRFVLECF